jgi:hypothetical protein
LKATSPFVPVPTFDEDTRKYVNHFARDTDDYFAYIFDPESDTENKADSKPELVVKEV